MIHPFDREDLLECDPISLEHPVISCNNWRPRAMIVLSLIVLLSIDFIDLSDALQGQLVNHVVFNLL